MQASVRPNQPLSTEWIVTRYGAFLDVDDLTHLLSFPTRRAVLRANATGRLGFGLVHIAGRKGLFARATDVGAYRREVGASQGVTE